MNTRALKAQMALAGLTAQALCELTGINPSSFYRKMAEKVDFTQGEISAIAKVLHMDSDTICSVFFADEVS